MNGFQYTNFNRKDFRNLLIDVNTLMGHFAPPDEVFEEHFSAKWPQLEKAVKRILAAKRPLTKESKKAVKIGGSAQADDMFPQVLEQLSEISRRLMHVESSVTNSQSPDATSTDNFFNRTSIHHMLVHQARDLAVELMGNAPVYSASTVQQDMLAEAHPGLEMCRTPIVSMLEKVAKLFEFTVPEGVRVWTCIRDRRADDSYHTFARAGRYNPNREVSSKAMHKDASATILRLKDSYKAGTCVLITGSTMGPQMWEP
jgi:hypothetical protein